jgi:hypothetical protein
MRVCCCCCCCCCAELCVFVGDHLQNQNKTKKRESREDRNRETPPSFCVVERNHTKKKQKKWQVLQKLQPVTSRRVRYHRLSFSLSFLLCVSVIIFTDVFSPLSLSSKQYNNTQARRFSRRSARSATSQNRGEDTNRYEM